MIYIIFNSFTRNRQNPIKCRKLREKLLSKEKSIKRNIFLNGLRVELSDNIFKIIDMLKPPV